jgi:hypothetical protein
MHTEIYLQTGTVTVQNYWNSSAYLFHQAVMRISGIPLCIGVPTSRSGLCNPCNVIRDHEGDILCTTTEGFKQNILLQVSCPSHAPKIVPVRVIKNQLNNVKVILDQETGQDEGYHTYTQIQKHLWHLNSDYPSISRLYR